MWISRMPTASQRAIIVGEGGAPPTTHVTSCSSGAASAWASSEISTVGAAHRCVAPARSSRQTAPGSGRGSTTLVAPTPGAAHVKHQPLQWNIGSVQRYVLSGADAASRRDRRARRGSRRGACRRRPWACPSCRSCSPRRSGDPRCRASRAAWARRSGAAPRTPLPSRTTRSPGSSAARLAAASSSGSSSSTCAPQCSTMKRTSGGARRVLIGAQRATRGRARRSAPPAARAG